MGPPRVRVPTESVLTGPTSKSFHSPPIVVIEIRHMPKTRIGAPRRKLLRRTMGANKRLSQLDPNY